MFLDFSNNMYIRYKYILELLQRSYAIFILYLNDHIYFLNLFSWIKYLKIWEDIWRDTMAKKEWQKNSRVNRVTINFMIEGKTLAENAKPRDFNEIVFYSNALLLSLSAGAIVPRDASKVFIFSFSLSVSSLRIFLLRRQTREGV